MKHAFKHPQTRTHLYRESCRQTDTQTDRQTDTHTHTHTHTHTRKHTPLQRITALTIFANSLHVRICSGFCRLLITYAKVLNSHGQENQFFNDRHKIIANNIIKSCGKLLWLLAANICSDYLSFTL